MSKVTNLQQQKRNKDRISIFIDNEFAMGVHKDLIIDHNIYVGKEMEEDFLEEVVKDDEQKKANAYALNLLSYRMRTERELYKRMRDKEYEEDLIVNAIAELKKLGYIDDRTFTEYYVEDKHNLNKLGKNKIKQELYYKGVEKEVIDEIIEEKTDDENEYNNALEVAQKRINSYKNEDKNKVYRKLGAFLTRRGFEYDIVKRVLKEVLEDFK